jgi:hypothetical protein
VTRFHERLTALLGETTYRTPVGGRSTGSDRRPAAHAVAHALAAARRHAGDVGPDVAVCMYLGTDYKRDWIVGQLAAALGEDDDLLVRRNRAHLRQVANAAFALAVARVLLPRPEGISERTWCDLVAVGASVLTTEAENAVGRASRKLRAA